MDQGKGERRVGWPGSRKSDQLHAHLQRPPSNPGAGYGVYVRATTVDSATQLTGYAVQLTRTKTATKPCLVTPLYQDPTFELATTPLPRWQLPAGLRLEGPPRH